MTTERPRRSEPLRAERSVPRTQPTNGERGAGWWQASDGNWYPPQPVSALPPPPVNWQGPRIPDGQAVAPATAMPSPAPPPQYVPPQRPTPRKPITSAWWFWTGVAFGGVMLLVGIVAAAGTKTENTKTENTKAAAAEVAPSPN